MKIQINVILIIVFGFYMVITDHIITGYEKHIKFTDNVIDYISNKCFTLSEGDDMNKRYR